MNGFNNRHERRAGVLNTNETDETVTSNLIALDKFIKKDTPTVPDFPNQEDRFDQAVFAKFTVQVHTLFTLGSANGTSRFGRRANDTFESYAEVKEALVTTAKALKEDENISKFGFYSRDKALEILQQAQDKYNQSVQDRMQIVESEFWPVLQFSLAAHCKDLEIPTIEAALNTPDLKIENVNRDSAETYLKAQYNFFDIIRQQLIALFEEVPQFEEFSSKKLGEVLVFISSFLAVLWQFSDTRGTIFNSRSPLTQSQKRSLALGSLIENGVETITINQDAIPLTLVSRHINDCLLTITLLKKELQSILSAQVEDSLFFPTTEASFLADTKVLDLLRNADSSQELSKRLVSLITTELERTLESQLPQELLPKLLENDKAIALIKRLAFPNEPQTEENLALTPVQQEALLNDLEEALEDWGANVSPSTLNSALSTIKKLTTQLQKLSSLLDSLNRNNFIPEEQQKLLATQVSERLKNLTAEEKRLKLCQKVYEKLTKHTSPQVQLWKQALDS